MANARELYKEGRELKEQGRYEEAIPKLNESLAVKPTYTLPLHALVECFTALARHDEAISHAQKIVEMEPNDHFSFIALSKAYMKAGKIPEAEYALMQSQQAAMRKST